MALWICRECTAAYAVGLPACPQCGGTNHEEDQSMPKISKGDGVSYEPGREPGWTPDQSPAPPVPATAQDAPEQDSSEPAEAPAAGAPSPAPAPSKD